MANRPLKIRFLAAFVIAFVCLNASGAVCLAYCQSFESAVSETEHCPLKKAVEHCDKSTDGKELTSVDLSTGELDCCPMTVSFFAAPVEKSSYSFVKTSGATASQPDLSGVAFNARANFPVRFSYRGPPPLERSALRNKNFILRI